LATRREKAPSGLPGGWHGELRSTPEANDETIRFASRMWPQVPTEEFERTGRRRRDHTETTPARNLATHRTLATAWLSQDRMV
jgi:hypothetical protein